MTTTPAIRVSEAATRAELEAAIVVQRAKAQRLSRQDPRRWELDDATDECVALWIEAQG